jgi:prepilin-type N-terminal cleavage/methylation domain-containing protein
MTLDSMVVSWTRERLASDDGFSLIELVVVLQIVGILTLIAVPTYLSYQARAQQATVQSNVRSAANGAELWDGDKLGGAGTYAGLMRSTLARELPSIDPNTNAVALNGGLGYCVEDSTGQYTYDYIGGNATPLGGWRVGVVQAASCLTAAGVAALSS